MRLSFKFGNAQAYAIVRAIKGESGAKSIDMVYVPKELRGRGLATALVGQICIWADIKGYQLQLKVYPFDRPKEENEKKLIRLYRKFGFVLQSDKYTMRRP